MTVHLDAAALAEMALANADPALFAEELLHLSVCSACRRELHALRRVVEAARSAEPGDLATDPPERVWRSIQQRIHRSERSQASPARHGPPAPAIAGARPAHSRRGPGRQLARGLAALAPILGAAAVGAAVWAGVSRMARSSAEAAARSAPRTAVVEASKGAVASEVMV
ncbi:hypothetical protein AB0M39_18015 [Streptomyces sp. NPDC051907]|uniref:hypothetical protein n=1 Tax=Streptomyces sp. NPDC051907 TaxID=3155284 RepID=UPI003431FBE5